MAKLKKQLKTEINGKTVEFYPITDIECVVGEDGVTTLKETLETITESSGNIFGVVDGTVAEEDTPKLNAETLSGYSAEDFMKKSEMGEYVTESELNSALDPYVTESELPNKLENYPTKNELSSTLSDYAKSDDIPTKLSDLQNDLGYSTTDTNTTYTLTKTGKTITLKGSDGSTYSVADADTNTTYTKLSEFTNDKGYITGITKDMIVSALGYTPSSSSGAGSLSDLGITATATELNYVDGVTSNIQTQLNNKADKTHSHKVADISDFPSTMTPSAHNQSASTITAGTFADNVVAPASTAYTTAHIRNIKFTTADPGEGTSASEPNGTLLCVYVN